MHAGQTGIRTQKTQTELHSLIYCQELATTSSVLLLAGIVVHINIKKNHNLWIVHFQSLI